MLGCSVWGSVWWVQFIQVLFVWRAPLWAQCDVSKEDQSNELILHRTPRRGAAPHCRNWSTNWTRTVSDSIYSIFTKSLILTSFSAWEMSRSYELFLCAKTFNQNWSPCQVETIQYQWSSHRSAGRTGPWANKHKTLHNGFQKNCIYVLNPHTSSEHCQFLMNVRVEILRQTPRTIQGLWQSFCRLCPDQSLVPKSGQHFQHFQHSKLPSAKGAFNLCIWSSSFAVSNTFKQYT